MKLYYTPGACSMGAHIVLREVGGPFELERVDLATKRTETGADFRQVNPRGAVPTLVTDAGEVVTEAPAIVQLIADRAGAGSLVAPAGTIGRARVQELLNFTSSELRTAFGPLFQPDLGPEERAWHVANIGRKLDWLESVLADGRTWLTGDAFTVADAYAFAVLGFANIHQVSLSSWPRVVAFIGRVSARPSVQAALRAEGLAA